MITTLMMKMWNDEAGFIISAELILVATITVLAMVVGLSEVAIAVNEELEDIGSAFGAVNQSYAFAGARGHKGASSGSNFRDHTDACDDECDLVCHTPIRGESRDRNHN